MRHLESLPEEDHGFLKNTQHRLRMARKFFQGYTISDRLGVHALEYLVKWVDGLRRWLPDPFVVTIFA